MLKCVLKTLGLLFLVPVAAFSQQNPQYSQYNVNPFLLNPAIAGSTTFLEMRTGYRSQWGNFPDAPKTFFLTGHAPLGKVDPTYIKYVPNHHGVGGQIISDVTGPLSQTGVLANYSYHQVIKKGLYLSLGMGLGFKQYGIDRDKLNPGEEGDVVIAAAKNSFKPDINVGAYLYSNRFFAGASVHQMAGGNAVIRSGEVLRLDQLYMHFFAMAGYRWKLDRDWNLLGTVVLKHMRPAGLHVDVNVKWEYKDLLMMGVGYRHGDAISGLIGLQLPNSLFVSYTYDYILSEITAFTHGSHEVMIGMDIQVMKDVLCPKRFW
ncbi:type IX secretion system membrane protein PorP/SprF [Persicobacter diffluens]|uniref:Type IX secretion system membrane protein PorP/SprF n=1 Tax=Persicobacter diffluens TaxID=981 RepID=A0AAN4W1F1_9BACT|nr:hypothetical protein PEDI_32970 [Persicobacter diffluens]